MTGLLTDALDVCLDEAALAGADGIAAADLWARVQQRLGGGALDAPTTAYLLATLRALPPSTVVVRADGTVVVPDSDARLAAAGALPTTPLRPREAQTLACVAQHGAAGALQPAVGAAVGLDNKTVHYVLAQLCARGLVQKRATFEHARAQWTSARHVRLARYAQPGGAAARLRDAACTALGDYAVRTAIGLLCHARGHMLAEADLRSTWHRLVRPRPRARRAWLALFNEVRSGTNQQCFATVVRARLDRVRNGHNGDNDDNGEKEKDGEEEKEEEEEVLCWKLVPEKAEACLEAIEARTDPSALGEELLRRRRLTATLGRLRSLGYRDGSEDGGDARPWEVAQFKPRAGEDGDGDESDDGDDDDDDGGDGDGDGDDDECARMDGEDEDERGDGDGACRTGAITYVDELDLAGNIRRMITLHPEGVDQIDIGGALGFTSKFLVRSMSVLEKQKVFVKKAVCAGRSWRYRLFLPGSPAVTAAPTSTVPHDDKKQQQQQQQQQQQHSGQDSAPVEEQIAPPPAAEAARTEPETVEPPPPLVFEVAGVICKVEPQPQPQPQQPQELQEQQPQPEQQEQQEQQQQQQQQPNVRSRRKSAVNEMNARRIEAIKELLARKRVVTWDECRRAIAVCDKGTEDKHVDLKLLRRVLALMEDEGLVRQARLQVVAGARMVPVSVCYDARAGVQPEELGRLSARLGEELHAATHRRKLEAKSLARARRSELDGLVSDAPVVHVDGVERMVDATGAMTPAAVASATRVVGKAVADRAESAAAAEAERRADDAARLRTFLRLLRQSSTSSNSNSSNSIIDNDNDNDNDGGGGGGDGSGSGSGAGEGLPTFSLKPASLAVRARAFHTWLCARAFGEVGECTAPNDSKDQQESSRAAAASLIERMAGGGQNLAEQAAEAVAATAADRAGASQQQEQEQEQQQQQQDASKSPLADREYGVPDLLRAMPVAVYIRAIGFHSSLLHFGSGAPVDFRTCAVGDLPPEKLSPIVRGSAVQKLNSVLSLLCKLGLLQTVARANDAAAAADAAAPVVRLAPTGVFLDVTAAPPAPRTHVFMCRRDVDAYWDELEYVCRWADQAHKKSREARASTTAGTAGNTPEGDEGKEKEKEDVAVCCPVKAMPELVEARFWTSSARALTAATRQRLAQLRVNGYQTYLPLRTALFVAAQVGTRVADVLAFQCEENVRYRVRERNAAKSAHLRTLRAMSAGTGAGAADLQDGRSTEQLVPQHVKAFRARRARAREQEQATKSAKRRRVDNNSAANDDDDNDDDDDDDSMLVDDGAQAQQQSQQGQGRSARAALFRPLRKRAKFQPQDELKMLNAFVAHCRAHGGTLAATWPRGTWRRLAIELGKDEDAVDARIQRLVSKEHLRRVIELALQQQQQQQQDKSQQQQEVKEPTAAGTRRLPSFETLAEFYARYRVQEPGDAALLAPTLLTRRSHVAGALAGTRPWRAAVADVVRSDPACGALLAPATACLVALAAQPAASYRAAEGFRMLAKYTHAQLMAAQALLTQTGLVVRNRAGDSARALVCSARFAQQARDLLYPDGLFRDAAAFAAALRARPCLEVPPLPPGGVVWEALNLADAHCAALVPWSAPSERTSQHLLARMAALSRPLTGVLCHLVNDSGDANNDDGETSKSNSSSKKNAKDAKKDDAPETTTKTTEKASAPEQQQEEQQKEQKEQEQQQQQQQQSSRGFMRATRLRADVVPLPTLQKLTVDVQLQNADCDVVDLFAAGPVDTLDRVVAPEQREMGAVAADPRRPDALLAALRVCGGLSEAHMARVRRLLAHIAAAGTAGLAPDAPALAAHPADLRALCDFGLVATVFDVDAPRIVAREHAGPWCVQEPPPAPTPGPGPVLPPPQADRYQPAAPWLFADGTLNTGLAAALQHRLLCLAARWPGIAEDALCAMVPLLPAHTRHLLAVLTARRRLRRTTLASPPAVTLLSSSRVHQTGTSSTTGSSSSEGAGVVHCYHVVPPFCTSASFDFLQPSEFP